MALDPRHHFSDAYHGLGDATRTISNFARYRDPASGLWLASDPDVEDSEEVVDGEALRWADRRNPLCSFVGDGSTAAKTGLITLADTNGNWAKLKLVGTNAVAPVVTRGERLTVFPGILDYTTLVTQRGRGRFHKHLRLSQAGHPAEFRWMVIQPAGHTWAIVDNSLRLYDAAGEEWMKTVPAGGRDSSGEFGNPIRVAMVMRAAIGNYGTFACRPNATDLAAATYPVEIDDPTASLSGAAAVDDTAIMAQYPTTNSGGLDTLHMGVITQPRRELCRCATASIPAGTLSALRLNFYRFSEATQAEAGTLVAYFVADANTWIEGTALGTAQDGSPCWDSRAYDPATPTNWVGSAGLSTSGADYDTDASPPSLAFNAYTVGADTLMTLTLRASWATAWRDATRANNGFLVRVSDEGLHGRVVKGRSTEYASNTPYFEIDYTLPTGPGATILRPSSLSHRRIIGG